MKSSFLTGSVKDDLFIREDVMAKYNIPSISSSTSPSTNYDNNNVEPSREEEL